MKDTNISFSSTGQTAKSLGVCYTEALFDKVLDALCCISTRFVAFRLYREKKNWKKIMRHRH